MMGPPLALSGLLAALVAQGPGSAQPGGAAASSRFASLMSLGQAAFEAEEFDKARAMLEEAVALRPDDAEAHLDLGRTYAALEQYQPAAKHLNEGLKLAPGHPPALMELARIQELAGRFDEAISYYREILSARPHRGAQRALARVRLKQGPAEEAVSLLRDLVDGDPADAESRYQLGVALQQRGDWHGAVVQLEEVTRVNPGHLGAWLNLGNCLNRLGRKEEASRAHDSFKKASQDVESRKRLERRVFLLLVEGLDKLEKGHPEAAIPIYEEVLGIKPHHGPARLNLGQALAQLGKLDEAIPHFKEALSIEPRDLLAHINLGLALAGKGDLPGAIAAYQEALRLDPFNGPARNNLALALSRQGKDGEAAAHYTRLLDQDPSDSIAHLNMSLALSRLGRPEEAQRHLEEAVKLNPSHPESRYHLGATLAGRGQGREAVTHLSEAVRLKPEYPRALELLAWILATHLDAGIRDGSRAVALAEKLREQVDDSRPSALDALAAAYAEQGRFGEAIRAARKGIDIATARGDAVLAEAIRERLKLYEAGIPFRERQRR